MQESGARIEQTESGTGVGGKNRGAGGKNRGDGVRDWIRGQALGCRSRGQESGSRSLGQASGSWDCRGQESGSQSWGQASGRQSRGRALGCRSQCQKRRIRETESGPEYYKDDSAEILRVCYESAEFPGQESETLIESEEVFVKASQPRNGHSRNVDFLLTLAVPGRFACFDHFFKSSDPIGSDSTHTEMIDSFLGHAEVAWAEDTSVEQIYGIFLPLKL